MVVVISALWTEQYPSLVTHADQSQHFASPEKYTCGVSQDTPLHWQICEVCAIFKSNNKIPRPSQIKIELEPRLKYLACCPSSTSYAGDVLLGLMAMPHNLNLPCFSRVDIDSELCEHTVPFHSIRMSRVTAAKIYEKFHTCHGSPRASSNVHNQSRKSRKQLEKSKFRVCSEYCFKNVIRR
jgi:hypothetical protein